MGTLKLHQPAQTHTSFSKLKYLYLFSIPVVFLAILFSFTYTNNYRIHLLKLTLSPHSIQFHKLLGFLHSTPNTQYPQTNPNSPPPSCVLWMAPFLSGGGYSSEAWSYILALKNENPNFRLKIHQHGDQEVLEFWEGLPVEMKKLASELYKTECDVENTIVVCHSEPGGWYPPLFQTLPCPPTGYGQFRHVIGRTMFETDRLNTEHVRRCNRMDSVWVPTDFHVSAFVQSGVDSSKVVKIVQPVDVEFFDPDKYVALDLSSRGKLVLGSNFSKSSNSNKKLFVFLSIFKWEYRKGWDALLQAYLKEFSYVDEVVLYLLTNPYHSDRDFGDKILDFVEDTNLVKPVDGWAPIYVIDSHIPHVDLPRLYKAGDAFVLPSRGEGWGRPIVESMAMSLPVIATNWSGPTEYLTEENSYPLAVDAMSEVFEGPFKGHLWAEPSVDRLKILMRRVVSAPEEAKARGRIAREDMISRFSPKIVAGIVTDNVLQILNKTAGNI